MFSLWPLYKLVVQLGIIGYRNQAERLITLAETNPKCNLKYIFHPNKKISDKRVTNNLNDLFDDIFSIEEVGVYKPVSKVYDIPVKKYKIKKDEIAFLSANTWDVSGGGNYGYQAIWVNRNNNIFDNLDYKPTNEIKSLKELINLI